jgi:ABC-type microcin C transport system permease subunit YejE
MNRRTFGYYVIVLIVTLIGVSLYLSFTLKDNEILEEKNEKLQQQLQAMKQKSEQEAYTEGEYTMITNLSSSIYLNRIPNNFDKIYPWEDANGVKGFDTISGDLYLRYVEGHIQWPQLALYAPEMSMQVVSDSKWPKEGP